MVNVGGIEYWFCGDSVVDMWCLRCVCDDCIVILVVLSDDVCGDCVVVVRQHILCSVCVLGMCGESVGIAAVVVW